MVQRGHPQNPRMLKNEVPAFSFPLCVCARTCFQEKSQFVRMNVAQPPSRRMGRDSQSPYVGVHAS